MISWFEVPISLNGFYVVEINDTFFLYLITSKFSCSLVLFLSNILLNCFLLLIIHWFAPCNVNFSSGCYFNNQ